MIAPPVTSKNLKRIQQQQQCSSSAWQLSLTQSKLRDAAQILAIHHDSPARDVKEPEENKDYTMQAGCAY
jgi:hypothetical protein